jgi:hypothetical protein
VIVERRAYVVPRRLAGEHEVVHTGEQPKRRVPARLADQPLDAGIVGEPAAERGIER